MNRDRAYKKIEGYLYYYNSIDIKIEGLKDRSLDIEYHQNYTRWIKSRCSSLENQVIRNIEIESRVFKLTRWKNLITDVINGYKMTNKKFYKFIRFKYFYKMSSLTIKEKLKLSLSEQKDIQAEILQYIFLVAIKRNILKEVNI